MRKIEIPTEPIGSIPRPLALLDALAVNGPDALAPIDPRLESAEEVRDRVLETTRFLPADQLGTTDDCGFAPFCDDRSTTRELAFAKIQARTTGTTLAARLIGGGS